MTLIDTNSGPLVRETVPVSGHRKVKERGEAEPDTALTVGAFLKGADGFETAPVPVHKCLEHGWVLHSELDGSELKRAGPMRMLYTDEIMGESLPRK